MAINQPEPGARLNDGPVAPARPSATVILLRGGERELEVLLVQRTPKASFMGGAWVFPGGSVDPADGEGEAGLRGAARRELAEETGIALPDHSELVPFARWITPEAVSKRFDTWFFLAAAPVGAEARVDGSEIVDARWLTPAAALDQQTQGELFLVFPTIKQLQQLSQFAGAQALLEHARSHEVHPVKPVIVGSGETARILLPGDPGYEAIRTPRR